MQAPNSDTVQSSVGTHHFSIARAFCHAALSFFGLEIKDCALASTPAMFMTTKMLGCDGAVQITASHHPWDRNGLKFFTPDGGLSGDEIKSILEYAEEHESGSCPERLNLQEVDFMSVYCEHLCNMIRKGVKSD